MTGRCLSQERACQRNSLLQHSGKLAQKELIVSDASDKIFQRRRRSARRQDRPSFQSVCARVLAESCRYWMLTVGQDIKISWLTKGWSMSMASIWCKDILKVWRFSSHSKVGRCTICTLSGKIGEEAIHRGEAISMPCRSLVMLARAI